MADEIVSINQVVDLVKELTRGSLRSVLAPGGLAMDCSGRCGCVGGDCGCFNQVSGRWDRLSWVEFQTMREQKILELKSQLSALEHDGPPKK